MLEYWISHLHISNGFPLPSDDQFILRAFFFVTGFLLILIIRFPVYMPMYPIFEIAIPFSVSIFDRHEGLKLIHKVN